MITLFSELATNYLPHQSIHEAITEWIKRHSFAEGKAFLEKADKLNLLSAEIKSKWQSVLDELHKPSEPTLKSSFIPEDDDIETYPHPIQLDEQILHPVEVPIKKDSEESAQAIVPAHEVQKIEKGQEAQEAQQPKRSDFYEDAIKSHELYGGDDEVVNFIFYEDDKFAKTESELKVNAQSYGYECKNVKPDGNCFYLAVTDQLNLILKLNLSPEEIIQLSVKLRNHACEYIKKNRSSIDKASIKDDELEKQNQNGIWVDGMPIIALCYALNVSLVLVCNYTQNPIINRINNSICTLYLGYQKDLHYQSLIPLDRIDNKEKQALLEAQLQNDPFLTLNCTTTIKTPEELKICLKNLLIGDILRQVELDPKVSKFVKSLQTNSSENASVAPHLKQVQEIPATQNQQPSIIVVPNQSTSSPGPVQKSKVDSSYRAAVAAPRLEKIPQSLTQISPCDQKAASIKSAPPIIINGVPMQYVVKTRKIQEYEKDSSRENTKKQDIQELETTRSLEELGDHNVEASQETANHPLIEDTTPLNSETQDVSSLPAEIPQNNQGVMHLEKDITQDITIPDFIQNIIKSSAPPNSKCYIFGNIVPLLIANKSHLDESINITYIVKDSASCSKSAKLKRSNFIKPANFKPSSLLSGLYTTKIDGHPIQCQFSTQSDLKKFIEENSHMCPFTISCVFFDKDNNYVIDPTGRGLNDCENRILDTVIPAEQLFERNPSQVLEAIKWILNGFKPTAVLARKIKNWNPANIPTKKQPSLRSFADTIVSSFGDDNEKKTQFNCLLIEYQLVEKIYKNNIPRTLAALMHKVDDFTSTQNLTVQESENNPLTEQAQPFIPEPTDNPSSTKSESSGYSVIPNEADTETTIEKKTTIFATAEQAHLQEEITRLKLQIEQMREEMAKKDEIHRKNMSGLLEINTELNKIAKLRERALDLMATRYREREAKSKKEKNESDKRNKQFERSSKWLEHENKQIKEENEKLKKELAQFKTPICASEQLPQEVQQNTQDGNNLETEKSVMSTTLQMTFFKSSQVQKAQTRNAPPVTSTLQGIQENKIEEPELKTRPRTQSAPLILERIQENKMEQPELKARSRSKSI